MIRLSKTARIASGATRPVDWQQYNSPANTGVFVDVDTSLAGFTRTPVYVCALHGFTHHWATTGASSIYNASPTGFRVYVRWINGNPITPPEARNKNWHIQWIGIED